MNRSFPTAIISKKMAAAQADIAAQLVRFLSAYVETAGPIVNNDFAAVKVRFVEAERKGKRRPGHRKVEILNHTGAAMILYAIATKNDRPAGLVQILVDAGAEGEFDLKIPKRLTLQLVVTETIDLTATGEHSVTSRHFERSKTVEAYP